MYIFIFILMFIFIYIYNIISYLTHTVLSHSCLHQVAFALGPSLLDLNFFSPLEDGPNIIPQPVTNTTTEVGVVHLTDRHPQCGHKRWHLHSVYSVWESPKKIEPIFLLLELDILLFCILTWGLLSTVCSPCMSWRMSTSTLNMEPKNSHIQDLEMFR